MQEKYDHLFKFVVVGNSGVGKSSLILRYTDDTFTSNFISTLGVDFKIRNIQASNKTVKLQIWDTAGKERFRTIAETIQHYTRSAHGILLCFDTTDRQSFEDIKKYWLPELERGPGNAPIFLIGTKSDLANQRAVSAEEATAFAGVNGLTYIETSSKVAMNVDLAFQTLAEKSLAKVLGQEKSVGKAPEKEEKTEPKKEKKIGKFKRMLGKSEKKKGDEKEEPRKLSRKERKQEETTKKSLQELKYSYGAAFTPLDDGTNKVDERILEKTLIQGKALIKQLEGKGVHPHLQAEVYFQLGRTAAALNDIPEASRFYLSAHKLGDPTMQADAKARIERLNPSPAAPVKQPVPNKGVPYPRAQRGSLSEENMAMLAEIEARTVRPAQPPAPRKPDGREKEPEKEKGRRPRDEENVEPEILRLIAAQGHKEEASEKIMLLEAAYASAFDHFGRFVIPNDAALKNDVTPLANTLIKELEGEPQQQAKVYLLRSYASSALGAHSALYYGWVENNGDATTKQKAQESIAKTGLNMPLGQQFSSGKRIYFGSAAPTPRQGVSAEHDAKEALQCLQKSYRDALARGADKKTVKNIYEQAEALLAQFESAGISETIQAEVHFLRAKTVKSQGKDPSFSLNSAKARANPDLQEEIAAWEKAQPQRAEYGHKDEPEKRKEQPKHQPAAPTPLAGGGIQAAQERYENLLSQKAALKAILEDSGYGNKSQSMVISDHRRNANKFETAIAIKFETASEAQALYMALRDRVGDQFISFSEQYPGGLFMFEYNRGPKTQLLPSRMISVNHEEIVESFERYRASIEKGETPRMSYNELRQQDHPRQDEPEKRKEQPKHQPAAPAPRAGGAAIPPRKATLKGETPPSHQEQFKALDEAYNRATRVGGKVHVNRDALEKVYEEQARFAAQLQKEGAPLTLQAELRYNQARTANHLGLGHETINGFLSDAETFGNETLKAGIRKFREMYHVPEPDTSLSSTQTHIAPARRPDMSREEPEKKEEVVYDDFGNYLEATLGREKADALTCPLSLEPFTDPVMAADGFTYEKADMQEWLKTHKTSPKTGAELEGKTLIPNWAIKVQMDGYRKDFEAQLPGQGKSL